MIPHITTHPATCRKKKKNTFHDFHITTDPKLPSLNKIKHVIKVLLVLFVSWERKVRYISEMVNSW